MADKSRDIFGRLLVDPPRLTRVERVYELRKLAAALQDGEPDSRAARWLGKALQDWLHNDGDLFDLLGVRPPRGSNLTPQRLIAQEAQDRALVRLAGVCGGGNKALAVLRGKATWPLQALDLRDALVGASTSDGAISLARRRLSRPRASREHV